MSVTPSPIGGFAAQFFDNNGVILSGGKIYTYAAGTTTPQATYTSASGVTPHANPIILDSAGRVPGGEIWLTDGLVYKFVIETSTGSLLGTYDNITGVNSNFVNYTVQEEVITATAGQTVFNLSTINYTPGTNSLTVYIDGVNQYVGDSYLETDSDTVTFTAGLHVGAEVKFTTAIQTTTGAVDASIVAYDPPFTGSVATDVEAKLAQYVSVKDFGAVGDGVTDDTAAIQAAIDAMEPIGGEVYLPAGLYQTTSTIVLDRKVTLRGQGKPFPVGTYNPTQQVTGAVIRKSHNGHGITVTGPSAYSESAGIFCISIISQGNLYPTGDGIRIDNVGSYVIEQCDVWSCGGNGFSIGVSSGDVTGQVFLRNLYVNNCVGYAYYIRSKWLRAYNIISDGCTWGAWFQDAPEAYVDGFHFEGFSVGGIRLAGGSGWATFVKGFVTMTNPTPYHGIYIENVAGNVCHTLNSVKFLGRDLEAGVIGALILGAAWKTRISDCYFSSFPNAIQNFAKGTIISNTVFDDNYVPIYEEGTQTRIKGCTFDGTTGPYVINHMAGGDGVWSDNYIDGPINPGVTAQAGNFGTNICVNNTGFKTASKGTTTAIASGTVIPHGMDVTPSQVFVQPVTPFSIPTAMVVGWDATNITITWTGGGSIQFSWQAFAVCSGQG